MNILPSLNPGEYARVLRMAEKPTADTLKKVSGVAALGLTVIGLLGFVIFSAMSLIPV